MKLVEFIEILQNSEALKQHLNICLPKAKFDFIDLYIEKNYCPDSEIIFIDAENLPHNLSLINNQDYYINFFPLDLLSEIITQFTHTNKEETITTKDIAHKILEYRISETRF